MTFWQENYSFIKEVYDTRWLKMVEWMDNVEMAIQKVCANRVYTSTEFKREKDNFQSLCKNLERAETKKWLQETLETLMKERAGEERKEEQKKLDMIIERHKSLIPRIQETLLKTECYWTCYSYGDDLMPVCELIDELKNRSVRDVVSANHEQTEEHIERQEKVITQLENKKRMVHEFIAKGERLMLDPNCPAFLEGHLRKLKEAWEEASEKAQQRKKALSDNYQSWETFEQQKVDCRRQLDEADKEFDSIKKIFDLQQGPADFQRRFAKYQKSAENVESLFNTISSCNDCIQIMLPVEKKDELNGQVKELEERMAVMGKTKGKLEVIEDFNRRLSAFDCSVSDLELWLADAKTNIADILKPSDRDNFSPEDRVTRAMEIQEDLEVKSDFLRKQESERQLIFPSEEEQKIPADAKKFLDRLSKVRTTLDALVEEVKEECHKFSQDVKFWAEFQTGIKQFEPWIKAAEAKKRQGIAKPESLAEARSILTESKAFQEECEVKFKILEEAAASAMQMTAHAEADSRVSAFKSRWENVHSTAKEWVDRMTTLVECWSELEGNVDTLNSWVSDENDPDPEDGGTIPIEKLEGQLSELKSIFAAKEKLVGDLDAFRAVVAGTEEAVVQETPAKEDEIVEEGLENLGSDEATPES